MHDIVIMHLGMTCVNSICISFQIENAWIPAFSLSLTQHIGQIKEGSVIAVHATVTGEVLVGCDDGKLIHYDQERTKSISDPSCDCRVGVEHGSIIKIHYDDMSKLLIIGFDHGRMHIKKCMQGLRNSLFGGTQRRECCCSLNSNQNLFALECLSVPVSGGEPVSPLSPPNLEVWCGTSSHEIEVWSLEVAQSATWSTETVDQIRKVKQVPVNTANENDDISVKLMTLSDDQTRMAVALATPNAPIIAIMDVEAKECLKSIPFSQSGMSSSSPLVLLWPCTQASSSMRECYSIMTKYLHVPLYIHIPLL